MAERQKEKNYLKPVGTDPTIVCTCLHIPICRGKQLEVSAFVQVIAGSQLLYKRLNERFEMSVPVVQLDTIVLTLLPVAFDFQDQAVNLNRSTSRTRQWVWESIIWAINFFNHSVCRSVSVATGLEGMKWIQLNCVWRSHPATSHTKSAQTPLHVADSLENFYCKGGNDIWNLSKKSINYSSSPHALPHFQLHQLLSLRHLVSKPFSPFPTLNSHSTSHWTWSTWSELQVGVSCEYQQSKIQVWISSGWCAAICETFWRRKWGRHPRSQPPGPWRSNYPSERQCKPWSTIQRQQPKMRQHLVKMLDYSRLWERHHIDLPPQSGDRPCGWAKLRCCPAIIKKVLEMKCETWETLWMPRIWLHRVSQPCICCAMAINRHVADEVLEDSKRTWALHFLALLIGRYMQK